MLEIRHVSKIYSTKGGAETKALDDVSITFGETGLVFLLGKSGSGKSTLLNVSGGLDEPTSGEVIVKGKSSKDFSGSDFDSYRNTFVGFVFQEYNILDEFNVEDNIALALELQGKPKDRAKIQKLLEDVDLVAYAKRKPNTLSGGQKQRIAIARALIKDPQIIMADEPTGALDSATGKQVFDTLKKLSETRLVIVVSHDREFAELYGDRIVELKDGKIISDVTKRSVPPQKVDENVSVLNGDTMTLKSGASLSDKNLKDIKEFLEGADGDVIITRGKKQVDLFKKANRMSEDGSGETFTETAEGEVKTREYSADEAKFIRSRLPVSKAVKIGASGLKLKPLRLFFTIFLSFIAFTLFGLFSTLMTYNPRSVAANSFAENGESFITLQKNYRAVYDYGYGPYDSYNSTKFTPGDVEELAKTTGAKVFGAIRCYGSQINNLNKTSGGKYYQKTIESYTVAEGGTHVLPLKQGKYPTAANEIAISSFMLDSLNFYGLRLYNEDGKKVDKNGELTQEDTPEDINENNVLNKILMIRLNNLGGYQSENGTPFKIVGVFDSGEVPAGYEGLKEKDTNGSSSGSQAYDESEYKFQNWFSSGLASFMIVSEEFSEVFSASDSANENFEYVSQDSALYIVNGEDKSSSFNSVKVYNADAEYDVMFIGSEKTSLAANEIIVSASGAGLSNVLRNHFNALRNELDNNQPRQVWDWQNQHPEPQEPQDWQYGGDTPQYQADHAQWVTDHAQWEDARDAVQAEYDEYQAAVDKIIEKQEEYSNLISAASGNSINVQVPDGNGGYTTEWRTPTKTEQAQAKQELISKLNGDDEFKNGVAVNLAIGDRSANPYKIVGIYFENDYGVYIPQSLYDSLSIESHSSGSSETTKYKQPKDAIYDTACVQYDKTVATFYKIYDICGEENIDEQTDVFYTITSSLYSSVDMVNDMASMLKQVFLWVGVVFAVFAALLLFNFISMSISNKRKEIGILRAVGARGSDVFKIFFAESGIIVGICLVLSIIGAVVLCAVINGLLRKSVGFMVTLFVFGVMSPIMMIALALVVALISTFLPVYFAAKKKPVESIRAL